MWFARKRWQKHTLPHKHQSGPVSTSSTSNPNELAQTVATRTRRMPGTAREGFGL